MITDFGHLADVINLVDIDAKTSTSATDDVFFFRRMLAFDAEDQVHVVQSGINTIILLNTTGPTGAEMSVPLEGFLAKRRLIYGGAFSNSFAV